MGQGHNNHRTCATFLGFWMLYKTRTVKGPKGDLYLDAKWSGVVVFRLHVSRRESVREWDIVHWDIYANPQPDQIQQYEQA